MFRDFTVVVALDEEHASEFKTVLPAWAKFCPQLFDVPWVILHDENVGCDFAAKQMKCVQVESPKDWPQRERMLSAFALQAPHHVTTKYFLKLDVDCFPTLPQDDFPNKEWFYGDPVFVSSPWGYSKPNNVLETLDNWGNQQHWLQGYPALNVQYDKASNKVCCPRIISYVYFGRTDWHKSMATLVGERLPVPSQDTFHWYCAKRMDWKYRTVKFKSLGWQHIGRGGDRLRASVQQAIGEA